MLDVLQAPVHHFVVIWQAKAAAALKAHEEVVLGLHAVHVRVRACAAALHYLLFINLRFYYFIDYLLICAAALQCSFV